MPDEKQDPDSEGLLSVASTYRNGPIENTTAHVRLKTHTLIRRLSVSLFIFFGFGVLIFQTTDLHDRLNLARQSMVLQPSNPELLKSMRKLAERYESEQLYGKAIETYEKLLSREEKAHLYPGSGNAEALHEATVASLESLYAKRSEYSKLANLYESHLAETERRYGSNDTILLTDISKLAKIKKKLGRNAEAQSLLQRSRTLIQIARDRGQNHR